MCLACPLSACRGPGNIRIPQETQEHAHASAAAPDRQGTRGKAAKGQGKVSAPGQNKPPRTQQAASAAGRGGDKEYIYHTIIDRGGESKRDLSIYYLLSIYRVLSIYYVLYIIHILYVYIYRVLCPIYKYIYIIYIICIIIQYTYLYIHRYDSIIYTYHTLYYKYKESKVNIKDN